MKIIFRIAKNELNILFCSPIAWLLSAVFLLQSAIIYVSGINGAVIQQSMSNNGQDISQLTSRIFSDDSGLFHGIISKIYLFMPLLTMGLISREVSSGTIKLLFSSPLTSRQIIGGKFLAMMMYSMLLTMILTIFGLLGIAQIKHADIGLICSGLIGVYLLLCTYSAIGLFMSCLSSYQVVAAIGTFVIFAVLEYLKNLWQGIDFIRDLTYFLSISGRTQGIVQGLISTKDVIYFLLIIFMFLSFSVIRLNTGRISIRSSAIAGRYIRVIILVLLIGYLSSVPRLVGYLDMTRTSSNSLVPKSRKILQRMAGEPLIVTSYINMFESNFWRGVPEQRNFEIKRWEPYLRYKPDIKLNYVYYYAISPENQLIYKYNPGKTLKQIAQQSATVQGYDFSMFRTEQEVSAYFPITAEENRYVIQMQYGKKSTVMHLYGDMLAFPSEAETDAGLERLLSPRLPEIVFATGEGERSAAKSSDPDYKMMFTEKTVRNALVNQGFEISDVSLEEEDIPDGITTLVIADPGLAFTPQAIRKIQRYISTGGNLFIVAEFEHRAAIKPVLDLIGMSMSGLLKEKNSDSPDLTMAYITPKTAGFSKNLAPLLNSKDPLMVSMPSATALTGNYTAGFKIEPLMIADSLAYLPADTIPNASQFRKPYVTTVALSRKIGVIDQKIIVSGDADFLSNAEMRRGSNLNMYLVPPLFGWFTNGRFPVDTSRPDSGDNHINADLTGVRNMKIIFYGIAPALLLASMSVFLISRKRK